MYKRSEVSILVAKAIKIVISLLKGTGEVHNRNYKLDPGLHWEYVSAISNRVVVISSVLVPNDFHHAQCIKPVTGF